MITEELFEKELGDVEIATIVSYFTGDKFRSIDKDNGFITMSKVTESIIHGGGGKYITTHQYHIHFKSNPLSFYGLIMSIIEHEKDKLIKVGENKKIEEIKKILNI
jgi:hypothetical protein